MITSPFGVGGQPVDSTSSAAVSSPRVKLVIPSGVVLIGSDCHYWPGTPSVAHDAFVKAVKELQPTAIILNGDVIDGAAISRHPPIGWDRLPTIKEEIEAAQAKLAEIMAAAPQARRVWPLGNHDARFETKLAMRAPEYRDVPGTSLVDHFPDWEPCWSCEINESVIVKHRFKGGIHATHNNTLWSGRTIVTGHDHMLKVTPFVDYNGARYGVSTGTLADPSGPQFDDYTEDNPKNWQAGFAILTFYEGRLLPPELVTVLDKHHIFFRGRVIAV